MILSVVVRRGFKIYYQEHPQGEYGQGCGEHPAKLYVHARVSSGHGFDILAQTVRPIKPRYRYNFEEGQIHNRYRSGVMIN